MFRRDRYKKPVVLDGYISSWAQYTIRLPNGVDRDLIQRELKKVGIPLMVYYIKPMHLQRAFKEVDGSIAECDVTERLCGHVLSLPMHPYLTRSDVEFVANSLR